MISINFFQKTNDSLYDQESIIIRYRICKKDNTYLWLETIVKPIIDQNEVIKLICTSRNITEQRIAQEKLKKKDQLLHAVAQAAHFFLSNTDLNQAITASIQILGTKAMVDRVYVFQNHFNEEHQSWYTTEVNEWNENNSNLRIHESYMHNIPFENIVKDNYSITTESAVCQLQDEKKQIRSY